MSAYDTPTETCPYCGDEMDTDWVDNGIGMVQCGPYHCQKCHASEIGPQLLDWYYKNREGHTIYLPGKRRYNSLLKKKVKWGTTPVLKSGPPFSEDELKTGYYKGKISPYANTVAGKLVDHQKDKQMYDIGLLDEKKI
ncbi:hypothetical protein J32TS6_13970 [Virgibacillus pantothenticus]|uniref:hypothetical protein n=1 Tax=Virgibacillus pantothenticus TaxID=1473 RepID=UPI001B003D93|nr:hypothetical protein [Virgibacillus pantothenticus]GIP62842.1 hypothetical protein J32TS6_13970 [Virgibacillus pantothenticus]